MKAETRASNVTRAEPADVAGAGSGLGLPTGLSVAWSAGYEGKMVANSDRTVLCRKCRSAQPAARLVVDHLHAGGEHSDDPADMLAIVWTRCPGCLCPSTLILGYGPNAGEADLAVLGDLNLRSANTTEGGIRPVF